MSRRRWAILLSIPIACSSFDSVDAPDAPDGSAPDGGGGGGDSGAPPGADAATDAGPARGCAGRVEDPAHFCDDFDTDGDIGFLWQHVVNDGGTIEGTDASYSGPRALKAGFPSGASPGTTAWLRRERDINLSLADKSRLALGFLLRVLDAPSPTGGDGYMHFALLTFDPTSCGGNSSRVIELNFIANGEQTVNLKGLASGTCRDGGGAHFTSFKGPYGIASFQADFRRVSIVVTKGACPGTNGAASLVLTVDDTSVPCETLEVDPFAVAGKLDLNVGAFAGRKDVTQPAIFIIDDVTLDVD